MTDRNLSYSFCEKTEYQLSRPDGESRKEWSSVPDRPCPRPEPSASSSLLSVRLLLTQLGLTKVIASRSKRTRRLRQNNTIPPTSTLHPSNPDQVEQSSYRLYEEKDPGLSSKVKNGIWLVFISSVTRNSNDEGLHPSLRKWYIRHDFPTPESPVTRDEKSRRLGSASSIPRTLAVRLGYLKPPDPIDLPIHLERSRALRAYAPSLAR